ncbi:MAG: hypothetical protein OEV59_07940 [Deltaproteobacteria bacterium]|nr:hypothetical protein [Deltaproteobacteria bacterium]
MSATEEARNAFLAAKKHLREKNLDSARAEFENAYRLDSDNPSYMSYHGMIEAVKSNKIGYGLDLCTRAIKKEFFKPDYYVNLARVYVTAGNKKGAIMALKKGLRFDPNSDDIHDMLIDLGVRHRQILPFLPRANFLNKYLGLLFRRIIPDMLRKKPPEFEEEESKEEKNPAKRQKAAAAKVSKKP